MKKTDKPQAPRRVSKPMPEQRADYHSRPDRALTKGEKSYLARLGMEAYKHQDSLGLVDLPAKDWRHAEQKEAVGKSSLGDCTLHDFRHIKAHFLHLLGRDDEAFSDLMRTGKTSDHAATSDTHEAREQWLAMIQAELAGTDVITIGYVVAIAKNKFGKAKLESLDARQLQQLMYTVRNRIAALTGAGNPKTRNKSQRSK